MGLWNNTIFTYSLPNDLVNVLAWSHSGIYFYLYLLSVVQIHEFIKTTTNTVIYTANTDTIVQYVDKMIRKIYIMLTDSKRFVHTYLRVYGIKTINYINYCYFLYLNCHSNAIIITYFEF